jgi:hypothetical protein
LPTGAVWHAKRCRRGDRLVHMRRRRSGAAAGFATGLLAIYFVPTGGWPLYVVLVIAVAALGGYLIGKWSAVGVAVGCNIAFSALDLFAYEDVFRITPNHDSALLAVILVGQSLVSVMATAMAVRLRRGSAARERARPSLL